MSITQFYSIWKKTYVYINTRGKKRSGHVEVFSNSAIQPLTILDKFDILHFLLRSAPSIYSSLIWCLKFKKNQLTIYFKLSFIPEWNTQFFIAIVLYTFRHKNSNSDFILYCSIKYTNFKINITFCEVLSKTRKLIWKTSFLLSKILQNILTSCNHILFLFWI